MNGFGGTGGEHHILVVSAEVSSDLRAGSLKGFRGFETEPMQAGRVGPSLLLELDHALKHPGAKRGGGAGIEINHAAVRAERRVENGTGFALPTTRSRC